VGLDDRDALQTLRAAVGTDEVIGRIYTRWFAIDMSARDLFPPDLTRQRASFGEALSWLLAEMIAQRADEPVAFFS